MEYLKPNTEDFKVKKEAREAQKRAGKTLTWLVHKQDAENDLCCYFNCCAIMVGICSVILGIFFCFNWLATLNDQFKKALELTLFCWVVQFILASFCASTCFRRGKNEQAIKRVANRQKDREKKLEELEKELKEQEAQATQANTLSPASESTGF